jgi:hypothetical protein
MKRLSKAGGKPIKARRGKTPEPEHHGAPKAIGRSKSAPAKNDTEVARLTRELSEAREQQTAASQVLQVISSFAGELDPVFQAILTNATRICEANFGVMQLVEGGGFRAVGFHDGRQPMLKRCGATPCFIQQSGIRSAA